MASIGSALPLRAPCTAGRWTSWRRGPAADSLLKAAEVKLNKSWEEDEVVGADNEEEVGKN